MKLIFGKASVLKPLKDFSYSRLVMDKPSHASLFYELVNSYRAIDARMDDYPRAVLSWDSIKRLDAWVDQWVSQHRDFAYNATGRECEAIANKLAADIMFFCEVKGGNNAQIIAGNYGGFGHMVNIVRGVDKNGKEFWRRYDGQRGVLKRFIGTTCTMF